MQTGVPQLGVHSMQPLARLGTPPEGHSPALLVLCRSDYCREPEYTGDPTVITRTFPSESARFEAQMRARPPLSASQGTYGWSCPSYDNRRVYEQKQQCAGFTTIQEYLASLATTNIAPIRVGVRHFRGIQVKLQTKDPANNVSTPCTLSRSLQCILVKIRPDLSSHITCNMPTSLLDTFSSRAHFNLSTQTSLTLNVGSYISGKLHLSVPLSQP